MLRPANDRLNYGNLLTPPPDYKTDFALGTTFGLDLEALVGIPMALFLSEDMNKGTATNEIVMLEGLRNSAERFAIMCEAGQIKAPHKLNVIFSLLENSVFEVALPKERSFHPKIWLIRYVNQKKQPLYRLITLSRNLTFDRSWDLAVCLEGTLKEAETSKNQPLMDFISFTVPYVKNWKKRNQIKQMVEELTHIHFDPMHQHITDFWFHPIGVAGYQKPPEALFDTYKDLLVISPFISKGMVQRFDKLALTKATKTLVTRRSEISKLSEELLSSFQVYAMKEMVVEGEEGLSGEELEEELYQQQDIHAKLYAWSKYNQHSFFIGSANCSEKAFHGNIEFLLQLQYKKWGFRMQQLLDELFGKEDKENPFELIETFPVTEDSDEDLADQLQKWIKQLCRMNTKATVSQEGNLYIITIEITRVPEGCEFLISPIAGPQETVLDKVTVIRHVQLEQLSEFYRVTASKDGVSVSRIIKIKTIGIPAERDKALFRKVINSRDAFMQYMAYLLSDNLLLATLEQPDGKHHGAGKWEGGWQYTAVLYESMLKIVSREPERMKEIERVMKLIDDPAIIPDEFKSLYSDFEKVARKVKP